MYGDVAIKLVKELKRHSESTSLPPYREEAVRQVVRETNSLFKDVKQTLEARHLENTPQFNSPTHQAVTTTAMMRHLSIKRNKRCLLAYHHGRLDKIKNLVWQKGSLPSDTRRKMSASEHEFYRDYYHLVRNYSAGVCDLLDLSVARKDVALSKGNRWVFVEIRVVKDAGTIETENGVLNLQVGTQHFVRRSDVEQLIQEGYVLELDH